MSSKKINDCFQHDKDRLTHFEAIEILKTNLPPTGTNETIDLHDAARRVLAKTISAPRPIPAHRNAAVDGYAYQDEDYDPTTPTQLQVTARIKAGDPLIDQMPKGQAARIFTGSVMPTPLTSVAMQEDVKLETKANDSVWVTLPQGLKPKANCRAAGEDMQQGATLVEAGTRLTPQHVAALASAGIKNLSVTKKLNVACLSTGNELIKDEKDFTLGKVFDSNGPMLKILARQTNCTVTDLGIVPDESEVIQSTVMKAAQTHDVIITSAGASKGEEDHMVTSLNKLGTQHMWQLAIKPGRPMSFGQIENCLFIGLPGNPVAAFICFLLYASPMLRRLSGEAWPEPPRYRVPANFSIANKKPNRREFLRGKLMAKDQTTWVDKYPKDGSGLIHSLTASDCLIELDENLTKIDHGTLVNILPFSYWGL